jgi:hypothetical protein
MEMSALRFAPRITGRPESRKYLELMLDPNGPVAIDEA